MKKTSSENGMFGSLILDTGLVQVSNTKALENMPVKKDLEKELGFEMTSK